MHMENSLPAIPAKRYFTIGEVSDLCGVKPYVLRYWEQEFTQLKPMKRRGNRRYYQHHEVLLIRRIRDLLYDRGFTISGARNQLGELAAAARAVGAAGLALDGPSPTEAGDPLAGEDEARADAGAPFAESIPVPEVMELAPSQLRAELLSIRALLVV
jgi:DNA-binding transcriptional MerR regulator